MPATGRPGMVLQLYRIGPRSGMPPRGNEKGDVALGNITGHDLFTSSFTSD